MSEGARPLGPLPILKAKVCLVGDLAVGKTSLIRRFVLNAYDDAYVTTLGTKVTKKTIELLPPGVGTPIRLDLMIWDIMGQPGFRELLKEAYFHGARGILAVADLTRRSTLDHLDDWVDGVADETGPLPTLVVVNKADLAEQTEFGQDAIAEAAERLGSEAFLTSAKTGDHVEEVFRRLGSLVARSQLEADGGPSRGRRA